MVKTKKQLRQRRHRRVRKKVAGTGEMPRMAVFKSIKHIYVQIIDDDKGLTIVSASTLDKEFEGQPAARGNIEFAKKVGALAAIRTKERGITKVVFDKGGFKYHGRIKALADGAREGGLEI